MPKYQTSPQTHVITDSPRCPLCSSPANVFRSKEGPLFEGYCKQCGDLSITLGGVAEAQQRRALHLISAWLRRQPASDEPRTIDGEDVERIIKDTPEYSILEKLDLTLNQIAQMSREPGVRSNFNYQHDFPLIYATSHNEAIFCVRELAKMGYVTEDAGIARMTGNGYKRLAEIQRAGRQSGFTFVAMWFDPSTNQVFDSAIKPAIEDSGYTPVRIDRVEHSNRIDDEIIGRIRGSRFMVADFTGQRHGVYFEAEMMLGLARTVIWMCKKDELKEVHFDTRQYNFIDYETVAEAKQRLYNRIIAIEGEGPNVNRRLHGEQRSSPEGDI